MLKFEKLSFKHQEEYEKYYQACPQKSSDTSFLNLYAWEQKYHPEVAFSEGLCWLRFSSEGQKSFYGPPLGNWNNMDWKSLLAGKSEQGAKFVGIPEVLAEKIKTAWGEKSELAADRDNWEYVYRTEDLRNLVGEKFRNPRKASNQFMQNNDYKFYFFGTEQIEKIKRFQELWMRQPQVLHKDFNLQNENFAINRVLENWAEFGDKIFGAAIEVAGNLVAYTIGEKQDRNNLIIHFEKALYEVKGAYPAINRLTLENLPDYAYVNREQDLGLAGLRKAKLEYNPVAFIKKFSLSFL